MSVSLVNRYYEKHPTEYSFSKSQSCFSGTGLGLLVGAAIVASPNLVDLPAAGADAIRMALRLDIICLEVAENLEAVEPGESPGSWATLVSGLDAETVQKEIDIFNSEMVSRANNHIISTNQVISNR